MSAHAHPRRDLLAAYLGPRWPRVVLLTLLILGGAGLQLVSPQLVRAFIDRAGAGGEAGDLYAIAGLYLGVALAVQAVSLAATTLAENTAWLATNGLRLDLARHALQLDLSFHQARTPGELIERVDGDVSELASFFSQLLVRLFGSGLLVAGALALLFVEDWRIGLVGAAYVLLTVAGLGRAQRSAAGAWDDSRQAHAELAGFIGERLAGTEDVRANGGRAHVMARLYRLMRTLLVKGRAARLAGSLAFIAGYAAFAVTMVAALGVGALLYSRGLITLGTVYLFARYVLKLDEPLKDIQRQVADLQRAAASAGRVSDLLRIQPTLVENVRAALPDGPLPVAFEGVSFRYGDPAEGEADRVLKDVSFNLAAGRVLGLLGRTGSGKTTLTRLLLRLYDVDAGSVRLGGVDVRDAGASDLRRRVGVVTQDVQLFAATVRDNLTFFGRRIADERILATIHELGLGEWIDSLPGGLDAVLKAGGKELSAGEAQLLALARVFLEDPGLVILDEASSRLDPATERLLEQAIDRLLRGRTAIVVAHRLATVDRADEIMVLEDGRIREMGGRRRLAGDPTSHFYRLLQVGLGEVLA